MASNNLQNCEKSRFYAKKIIFLPILGGRAPGAPPPESAPDHTALKKQKTTFSMASNNLQNKFIQNWYRNPEKKGKI
jgi:hypothetical protein